MCRRMRVSSSSSFTSLTSLSNPLPGNPNPKLLTTGLSKTRVDWMGSRSGLGTANASAVSVCVESTTNNHAFDGNRFRSPGRDVGPHGSFPSW